ncbi:Curli assembly protein CsgE [Nitrosomonas cryotolerans]|uniref:Curli production assembly/transport component CsgE n=1 Tax=Nitrosomonas cryotolerans ATCC 49181 TaxID=1131553 RepID=A0A1N6H5G1_9PROT|nr:CsgE family curli-type amyloid fiber assembly protein [Nitrosomonas cryotolerans]SFP71786.1 Curli assembly protein CsgE [Nitrosomonas cryotolerans]SIO15051.1 Curli assembly protein CsgE [Nitrosomonas cryotolerans ATCC 49181]
MMNRRPFFVAIITISIFTGTAERTSAQDLNNSTYESTTPGANAATAPIPGFNDSGFIDSGVLEGLDTLEGDLEIGGLLIDNTLTKFGHMLFDAFNRYWNPPEGAQYNIAFSERIDPLRGSLITVKLNDAIIFENFVKPREEAISDLGMGLARDIRTLVLNVSNLQAEEFY